MRTRRQLSRAVELLEQSIFDTTTKPLTKRERLQRRRLHHFLRGAWGVLEPSRQLEDNWHLELIAEYLEAISAGQLQKVLINIMPRSLKSIECSVAFPCWDWIAHPERRFLSLSYSGLLANDHNDLRRSLIKSHWYQRITYGRIMLSSGTTRESSQQVKNRISEFANNYRGQMISRGFDGSVTGTGGDIIICLPYEGRILTERGWLKIGDIVEQKMRVLVYSFNDSTGEKEYSSVLRYEKSKGSKLLEVDLGDRVLRCTEDHPVWTPSGYVPAKDLQQGNEVMFPLTMGRVESITRTGVTPNWVYNIATDNRNYFADGVLVHNCDDPNNPEKEGDKNLKRTKKRFRDFAFGRKNSKTAAVLVVQQRTDKDDVSGLILDELNDGDWEILKLPTCAKIYTEIVFPLSNKKIIRQPGDFLHPARHGAAEDREARKILGGQMYAGRHDQEPIALEGGVFPVKWYRFNVLALPKTYHLAVSVDSSFGSMAATSSYVSIGLWAIARPNFYRIDQRRDRMGFEDTKKAIRELRNKWAHLENINLTLIEKKANGASIIENLKVEFPGVIGYEPGSDSKMARAMLVAPIYESGNVLINDNVSWFPDYEIEFGQFPNGSTDQVDESAQLITYYLNRWRKEDKLKQSQNQPMGTTAYTRGW